MPVGLWHGCAWSDVEILDRDITDKGEQSEQEIWEWKAKRPEKWEPSVEIGRKLVKASFIVFNPVGVYTISKIEDVYSKSSYAPKTNKYILSRGQGGKIY